ncbi:hypothetical protein VF14_10395 [Nostoc linckia z18]|uniref:Uncharacterized protein n=2 Tax=Nostoc linckia TaxID=92942 RepID=A0A9Q5Z5F9_NOSLI|nr:hypothetical protein VF02_21995 [Nostoc linckia z1]PHJ71180.1 hypothetical protein VF03_20735 [Nostoc linckia z2]PHJ72218.1 hypothetical protein VF05_04610 [Nostoc linckia z3]PHJ84936.1 hypothetical protein VF07_24125 [Nostoc linckia z6]PHJ85266.1 hypothetical protein VF06_06725 [Nostoc linckia z4]PHJ87889.1 hypothetical protein VF04_34115 [Nostoc linckia z7]PHJ94366.1 hypothetical protein VF08_33910 [Nostoc linckia z8]PHK10940.1 hypothetical protein VF09_09355 [Nostoc linckia z9]PHK2134
MAEGCDGEEKRAIAFFMIQIPCRGELVWCEKIWGEQPFAPTGVWICIKILMNWYDARNVWNSCFLVICVC